MRVETKNIQTRLDDLAASDERTASTIMNLLSWCEALSRAVETQRQENHRSVDRTADIINGELATLRTELTAIADKLRGDKEPETVTIQPPLEGRTSQEQTAYEAGAACARNGHERLHPDGMAKELRKAFYKGWDLTDRAMKNENVTVFPVPATA